MSSGDGRIVGKSRVDIVEKAWIIREWYLVNGQDGRTGGCTVRALADKKCG